MGFYPRVKESDYIESYERVDDLICGFISLVLVVTYHNLGLCLRITRSYWEYIFDPAGPEVDPENL